MGTTLKTDFFGWFTIMLLYFIFRREQEALFNYVDLDEFNLWTNQNYRAQFIHAEDMNNVIMHD